MFDLGCAFDSLYFYYDVIEADEISPVCACERFALVANLKRILLFVRDLARSEFESERFVINLFEKATPQHPMHFHGGADNRVGLRVSFVHRG